MSTESKRTTIYLPPELEKKLDKLKQERFFKTSQSQMIKHLIELGMEHCVITSTVVKPTEQSPESGT